ncbi:MAG: cell division protein FtsZ [Culturomica sp.]|jgi:cell division protein FtsZ|nr:cell division protein FtsZ [Culturomica sp.]
MIETIDTNDFVSLKLPIQQESIIKVVGVGGGGSNAVNHMCRLGIHGVEFVVCNTDIQALRQSPVKNRIQLGKVLTEGLGAGCVPERGRQSAIESMDFIDTLLKGKTKMVFITAGMGGGTGTGAAPEIARKAKELGILTIGIVTLPFTFEGKRKMEQAMDGIDDLEQNVDALLIIQNDKLKDIYGDLNLSKAFAMADNVLAIAAKSIAEIITFRGYVNVDFADVDGVMRNSGVALMGAAEAEGSDRASVALHDALISPLLNSHDITGASNILVNMLYGDKEVTMDEVTHITTGLQAKMGGGGNVIWGTGRDESLGDKLRVAVIAVGFNRNSRKADVAKEEEPKYKESTPFKIEEIPEELELVAINTAAIEEKARIQREKMKSKPKVTKPKTGKNELPDVDSWFKGKLGGFFDRENEKDTDLK